MSLRARRVAILMNVKTKRQANLKDFKRFGSFKGLVEQKKTNSTHSCVNWTLYGMSGPV
jgi:hypothetical protein